MIKKDRVWSWTNSHYQQIMAKMKHKICYNIFLTHACLWIGRLAWPQTENDIVHLSIKFWNKPYGDSKQYDISLTKPENE